MHLFTKPVDLQGVSHFFTNDNGEVAEHFVNDVNGVKILVDSFVTSRKHAGDPGPYRSSLQRYPEIVSGTIRRLNEADYINPSPFKKAAALTYALIEHQPVIYVLAEEPSEKEQNKQWELALDIAITCTQLFIMNSFGDVLENKGLKEFKLHLPKIPSVHFSKDFRRYLMCSKTQELPPLSLVWESLTYMANAGGKVQIAGIIDSIDP